MPSCTDSTAVYFTSKETGVRGTRHIDLYLWLVNELMAMALIKTVHYWVLGP